MLLIVSCKKCCNTFRIDIGDEPIDVVEARWKRQTSFQCNAGCHMENSSPLDYWTITGQEEGHAPSDEEFMKNFEGREHWTTEEFSREFKNVGFCAPCVTGTHIPTGRDMVLEFCHTPSGKRIYYD